MRCEQFRENLEALLSGELEERSGEDAREHAESCAGCARMLCSQERLIGVLREQRMRTMPASVQGSIRTGIRGKVMKRPVAGPSGKLWALAGALVVVFIVGFLLLRQQPVTAAEIVARAEAALEGISTYHLKYRSTLPQPDGRKGVAYDELWYEAPDKLRSALTQQGSTMENLVIGEGNWIYTRGSDVAFLTPIAVDARNQLAGSFIMAGSPKDILKEFGKGYRYAGTDRIGERECDVIEGHFPNDRHVRACIDRKTGIVLQYVVTERGRLVDRSDIDTLEVDKPISGDVFKLQLPPGALLIKAPIMSSELFFVSLTPTAANSMRRLREPSEVTSELTRLAEQGAANRAKIKRLYEPGHVPGGYMLAGVGTYGERHEMPDGSVRVDMVGGYSTAYIDYVNPRTGDTIVIMESANKLGGERGRAVLLDGFRGAIETHAEPFPYIEVFWQSHNTYFSVSASSLGEQEVVSIARSLCPLGEAARPSDQEGTWMIRALVEGTVSETEVSRVVRAVRERLKTLGLQDSAIVEGTPTGRIEVRVYTRDPDEVERRLTASDDLPVKLIIYKKERL